MSSMLFISLGTFVNADSLYEMRFYGLVNESDLSNTCVEYYLWPLAALLVTPVAMLLIDIFLFKNRQLQMRVCGICVGLEIGLSVMILACGYVVADNLELPWHFDASAILPLAAAVLTYLAYRGIDDDEALIRSLNRLR